MKTSIDNAQRVFIVKYSDSYRSHSIFCNLNDIPSVVKQAIHEDGSQHPYKILHYWNDKLQACSKKYINEMFQGANIDFKLT